VLLPLPMPPVKPMRSGGCLVVMGMSLFKKSPAHPQRNHVNSDNGNEATGNS
jgi:hypothetical protein